MTPSANKAIIQSTFKSVYIVFKAPKALFTVETWLSGVFAKVAKLGVFKGVLAATAHLCSFLHLYTKGTQILCSMKDKFPHQEWNYRAELGQQLPYKSPSFHTGACNVNLTILFCREVKTTHSTASAKWKGPASLVRADTHSMHQAHAERGVLEAQAPASFYKLIKVALCT